MNKFSRPLFKAPISWLNCDYSSLTKFPVVPVIPGMFVPPHPTPAAPSPFAIVRWWLSQDYDAHRLECSIAGFATQLDQNRQRLRVLDQEHESLKLELSQALERKRQVRHRPTLPNYRQMYRNFDAALEAMRTLRHDLPLHQCTPVSTCAQGAAPSYPEWLVPPKRLRWYAVPTSSMSSHPCQHKQANTSCFTGGSGVCWPQARRHLR